MRRGFLLGLLSCALVRALDDPYGIDDIDFAPNPPPPPQAGGGFSSASSCQFSPAGTNLHFDLSPMRQTSHDFTSATAGGYTYRFNVCGDAVKVCNSQPAPAAKWRGTKCNNLGDRESLKVSLLDPASPTKGLKLAYDQGDICKKQTFDGGTEMGSRYITYEISCSAGEEGTLKSIREVTMCEYVVLFESKYACPITAQRSLYTKVMTLLVISFALYCLLGAFYNVYYQGAKGLDAVPNKAAWEEVPGLVREGAAFSYEKGKVYGSAAYEAAKVYGGAGYEMAKAKYEQYQASRAGGA